MTEADWGLLAGMVLLMITIVIAAATGGTKAEYTPKREIAPVTGRNVFGFAAYCAYMFLPTTLHIKEAIQWHISRSRI